MHAVRDGDRRGSDAIGGADAPIRPWVDLPFQRVGLGGQRKVLTVSPPALCVDRVRVTLRY